jgi:hypothetical protein
MLRRVERRRRGAGIGHHVDHRRVVRHKTVGRGAGLDDIESDAMMRVDEIYHQLDRGGGSLYSIATAAHCDPADRAG